MKNAGKGKVRVLVNGFGVIGKRVADAVSLQDDMVLVGVCDVGTDYRIRVAVEKEYPVFAADSQSSLIMTAAGIPVSGLLDDALAVTDVVADCTPKHVAARHREMYSKRGVKAIWQGGESHDVAGVSFVAQLNYSDSFQRDSARVVSCNTTGLARVLGAFQSQGWLKQARAVLVRRATDPWESHINGMINTVVPERAVPSHQSEDLHHVLGDIDVVTMAASASHNLSHIHFAMVKTHTPIDRDELLETLRKTPRITLVSSSMGLVGLHSVIELMRDLGRPRADLWEVAIWEDILTVQGDEVYLPFQVHNEAIVVPETIDCIRAVSGIEESAARSIAKTDRSLGIMNSFLPATTNKHGATDDAGDK